MALRVPGAAGSATLTRQQLESLATPLFRRLRLPIDVACWQVGWNRGECPTIVAGRHVGCNNTVQHIDVACWQVGWNASEYPTDVACW